MDDQGELRRVYGENDVSPDARSALESKIDIWKPQFLAVLDEEKDIGTTGVTNAQLAWLVLKTQFQHQ